jgi:chromate reductase, NAD(P)H dehydrogenase (quinone)
VARYAPSGITASLYSGLRALPAYLPGAQPPPGEVTYLRRRVDAADAVLFCTPEYAGSLPGSLKNLLDWLIDTRDLDRKPVAWLSVAAAGQDDGARAMLETVLSLANARILRAACIRIPLSPSAVDRQGIVTDQRLHTALLDMLRALTQTLAAPHTHRPTPTPSWQAYSSVFPLVDRPDAWSYPGSRNQQRRWQQPGPGGPSGHGS